MSPPRRNGRPKRRLLVVDADPAVSGEVREFFAPHGFDVVEAADAAQALARAGEAAPDAIVADPSLPGMDGWAFQDEVRRRPDLAGIPFVFAASESGLAERLRGFHAGVDDWLAKPFAVEELHARVERLLARRDEARRAWLQGNVEHLALSDLLQILSLNGKNAVVRLRLNGRTGELALQGGHIVHAACDTVGGPKAIYRMLGWAKAAFVVLPPDACRARTMDVPATHVLMDGLVSLDEWNRWRGTLPDEASVLEPAGDPPLPGAGEEFTPAEIEVLGQADAQPTLGELWDGSPRPDGELAEAVAGLVSRGLVRVTSL